jgi:hypothetical protein
MEKKRVFISYAHKDGMDFTRRLAFALGLYMDVFWDRRLQAGDFPEQLKTEIQSREFLLFVMTPYSLESGWCQDEITYAETHGKKIVLAKVFNGDGTDDINRVKKYTYGDFTEDFEVGFRSVTAQMIGSPRHSWEQYAHLKDEDIFTVLKNGLMPGLISKEIVDWVILEKLWRVIEKYADQTDFIYKGSPRTPWGVLRSSMGLISQFTELRDALGAEVSEQVKNLIVPLLNQMLDINDDEHQRLGELAHEVIIKIQVILRTIAEGFIDAKEAYLVENYYQFDVSERLRELINVHARRSRYLY